MSLDPLVLAAVWAAVLLIGFMKGAFGGGFAIAGIPLLALVMDPIEAGALLAPLFIAMDVFALRYWRARTWSVPDLVPLLPALVIGIGIGWALLAYLSRPAVATFMGTVTLAFAALWFVQGGRVVERPRSVPAAVLAGFASGITTMVAHAGGPPVAMYLLRRGLPKAVLAGTTSLLFTVANAVKVGPWLLLPREASPAFWILMAASLPLVPLGVWAGWNLHSRLDGPALYRVCYGLLVLTALKLVYDGLSGSH